MHFDWRLLIVLLPIVGALSWALYNIAPVALRQLQSFMNRPS